MQDDGHVELCAVQPRPGVLLPLDLRSWLPEDDVAHFAVAAAEAAMLALAGKPHHPSLAEIAAYLAEAHGVLAETRSVCRGRAREVL